MIHRFLLLAFLLGCSASEPPADSATDLKGVKVLPKLDAEVKVGNETIDQKTLILPWTVQDVNGEWLCIGGHRKGWVQRSKVVTLDEAPGYYTQLIKGGQAKAWAYTRRATAWMEKGDLDLAIADYEERLRLQPDALTYSNLGNALVRKKDVDKAIAEYNEAVQHDPSFSKAYFGRGRAWESKKDHDKAIADYNEAIRLAPNDPDVYLSRGVAWTEKKDYDNALADFNEAIRLDAHLYVAYNDIAWLMATCSEERFRNGKKAVDFATRACELNDWKVPETLATLGQAYAEAGDFDSAIKYEHKAIDLTPKDAPFRKGAQVRLALYREHKPCRGE